MQISAVSLALTWPLRPCLLSVLPDLTTTATIFPLSKHTRGGDTAPAFSGLCVYLQFMWEVGLPPSPVEFSSHHQFYKLSRSWLLGVCSYSCLLQPACERFSLPSFSALRVPRPLCYCLFCCYCLLFSFSFFPGWDRSVQGAMLIWPSLGCLWEYRVPLSSPCGPRLPKPSGCWRLIIEFSIVSSGHKSKLRCKTYVGKITM
jgi:hypothetical protein